MKDDINLRQSQLGPKASKMTWEEFTCPAIVEIVCKPTGRRLIAYTDTPNLRRATYFYNLRNIHTYNNSNVFFGCIPAIEDLKKHGIRSFYFEIVKSMPNASEEELKAARDKYMKKFKQEELYNKPAEPIGYAKSIFAPIDPEMKKLEEQRAVLYKHFREAEAYYKKFRTESRNRRLAYMRDTSLNSAQRKKLIDGESGLWRMEKAKYNEITENYRNISREIMALNKVLTIKYGAK
jgi:hypothetical protein